MILYLFLEKVVEKCFSMQAKQLSNTILDREIFFPLEKTFKA